MNMDSIDIVALNNYPRARVIGMVSIALIFVHNTLMSLHHCYCNYLRIDRSQTDRLKVIHSISNATVVVETSLNLITIIVVSGIFAMLNISCSISFSVLQVGETIITCLYHILLFKIYINFYIAHDTLRKRYWSRFRWITIIFSIFLILLMAFNVTVYRRTPVYYDAAMVHMHDITDLFLRCIVLCPPYLFVCLISWDIIFGLTCSLTFVYKFREWAKIIEMRHIQNQQNQSQRQESDPDPEPLEVVEMNGMARRVAFAAFINMISRFITTVLMAMFHFGAVWISLQSVSRIYSVMIIDNTIHPRCYSVCKQMWNSCVSNRVLNSLSVLCQKCKSFGTAQGRQGQMDE